MRIFITGGSGFVGSNMIRFLVERHHSVVAIARSDAAKEAIAKAGATPIEGDLFSEDAIRRGMRGCDAVIHGAALMKFTGHEREMVRVNIEGTRNVLTAACDARVPRFVGIGAAAVLSVGRPIVNADESTPVPAIPAGGYARTKVEADRLILRANGTDLTTSIIRPPAIWGLGDPFLLPSLSKAVRSGRFAWIDGGRYPFAFCHVRNVCEAALLAVQRAPGGSSYLIADTGPHESLREFFSALLATRGLSVPRASVPRPFAWMIAAGIEGLWVVFRRGRSSPITRAGLGLIAGEFTINDALARRELGYTAHVSRTVGLNELAASTAVSGQGE